MQKDKFADLDAEFKDAVEAMEEAAIRSRIAQVALDQETLMRAKEDDEDLAEKQFAAKEAGEVYRDGTKRHRLMIQFAKRVLEDRGRPT